MMARNTSKCTERCPKDASKHAKKGKQVLCKSKNTVFCVPKVAVNIHMPKIMGELWILLIIFRVVSSYVNHS